MKILFVVPYVPSLIRARSYNLIQQLAARHDVAVLATDSAAALPDAASLRRWCPSVHLVPLRRGQAVRSCLSGVLRGEPLQAAVCRSPKLERRLTQWLAEDSFDVVHVEHLRGAHLRTAIPNGIPTVFDSVDCISQLLERTLSSSHSLVQRAIAAVELSRTRAYEARVLRQFDRIAVSSVGDCQALRALAPGAPVAVIPNGVDLDYFRPLPGPREPGTLVFSGKMSYHANATAVLSFVSDVLPLIRRVRPDVRLRIVGSAPPAPVRSLAADPGIEVTGYVPDLREPLGTSAVAICPVRVKAGTQFKVLEAMAMGLPVVCSSEGVEGLEAAAGRDLLVADTPQAFADHVCRLLGDGALREEIGRAGRSYVEAHHRWDAAAEQLEALYSQAVSSRRPLSPAHPPRTPAFASGANPLPPPR